MRLRQYNVSSAYYDQKTNIWLVMATSQNLCLIEYLHFKCQYRVTNKRTTSYPDDKIACELFWSDKRILS